MRVYPKHLWLPLDAEALRSSDVSLHGQEVSYLSLQVAVDPEGDPGDGSAH